MDANTLITNVRLKVGRGDDTSLDTEILASINQTQREIQAIMNFQEMLKRGTITLVASTQSYDLDGDFLKMKMVWNNATHDHEMTRIYPEEYKNYLSDIDTTEGVPAYYDIYDVDATNIKQIHFFPVPSAAATAQYIYYERLSDLSAGDGANALTSYYPDLYIEGAVYYIYRDYVFRDSQEKIAFRKAEYLYQIDLAKRAQRQPNRIDKIGPKRILPSTQNLYNSQYTGYTS